MDKSEVDILIVGAGPVGLFLANECARRGLRFRIVEMRPHQSEHSKALAVMPRTMEIFDMAGVSEPFLNCANRVNKVGIFNSGRRLADIPFEPDDTPYPFVAMVPQDVTERLLVEQLQRNGAAVEYQTSFVSAQQIESGVRVVLDRNGKSATVAARYVVGCDGAHSNIRHCLNLPFEGSQYQASFMLADVLTNETLPADEMQLCPSTDGPLAIFPMNATRRRVVATLDRIDGDAPSLDLVQKILNDRAPAGIEVRSLLWSSYFRVHHRQVSRLNAGRLFIAGDAAHIHSPIGGQGMNTGLQDVWNLAWKLELAVRGRATPALLESYTTERRPVIKGVIAITHVMTTVMATRNRLVRRLRDAMIPLITRQAIFKRVWVQRLSGLGIHYAGSPIVKGRGERFFDDSLRGGQGISGRYILAVNNRATPADIAAATTFEREFPGVIEVRQTLRAGVSLVRPDGYIACATDGMIRNGIPEIRNMLKVQVA